MPSQPDNESCPTASEVVLDTYRYLRAGMLVWVLMLAVAVGLQVAASHGCFETSISAYYYTAAHSAFVAAVFALGVCLIVYKGGSDTEDVLLNLSGMLAFVVAMVPLPGHQANCTGPGMPVQMSISPAIHNNIAAVLCALGVATLAAFVVYRKARSAQTVYPSGWLARTLLWVFAAVITVTFLRAPGVFAQFAHPVSAIAMFGVIILVVVINAIQAHNEANPREHRISAVAYAAVALMMAGTVVAALLGVLVGYTYWILVAEIALIAEFATYWTLQTVDLWNVVSRGHLEKCRPDPIRF